MHSCLDLTYSMEILNRFCSNSRSIYIKLVKHVLHYVSRILHLGLTFDRKADTSDDMIKYTNSDFIGLKLN